MNAITRRSGNGLRRTRIRAIRTLFRNRAGQTLPFVAAAMVAMLAMLALAIDLGMLMVVRSEAQRAADSGSLAGASAYLDLGFTSTRKPEAIAEERGTEYGTRNHMGRSAIAEEEVTVTPEPDDWRVEVTVRRGAVATWFARILGIDSRPIGATAVAEAVRVGAASCLKPFAIPVRENQPMSPGELVVLQAADESLSPVDPFFFSVKLPPDNSMLNYCPLAAGNTDQAWGGRNVCNTCDPPNGRFPGEDYGGWHQGSPVNAWLAGARNPSGPTHSGEYVANICNTNCGEVRAGERIAIETGDVQGPTAWGINALLAQDPYVVWVNSPDGGYIARHGFPLEDYLDTPRVIKILTYDPDDVNFSNPNHRNPLVTGFAYFFLEKGPQNGFYDPSNQAPIMGRFLFQDLGGGEAGKTGPWLRYLRLVK